MLTLIFILPVTCNGFLAVLTQCHIIPYYPWTTLLSDTWRYIGFEEIEGSQHAASKLAICDCMVPGSLSLNQSLGWRPLGVPHQISTFLPAPFPLQSLHHLCLHKGSPIYPDPTVLGTVVWERDYIKGWSLAKPPWGMITGEVPHGAGNNRCVCCILCKVVLKMLTHNKCTTSRVALVKVLSLYKHGSSSKTCHTM